MATSVETGFGRSDWQPKAAAKSTVKQSLRNGGMSVSSFRLAGAK
jgi:hypothetical protein